MSRTVSKEVYQYDELNPKAQEKARDWFRECEAEDFDPDYVLQDAETICGILGVELSRRTVKLMNGKTTQEPDVYWALDCRDQGASFAGTYRYARESYLKIRRHAPEDKELHRIADELKAAQRTFQYALVATIAHGRDAHSRDTTIEVEDSIKGRDVSKVEESVKEALRDLMDWIYNQLQTEYDYRLLDEQIEDSIKANEYEFNADGSRA